MNLCLPLVGPRIRLRPMDANDADALLRAASDGELWNMKFTVIPSRNTVHDYINTALQGREAGTVMPFITEELTTEQPIGSTRF